MVDNCDGYAAIGDHALIGDCHGAALIDTRGTIDWCCLERFDAEPVFCALLDAARGGRLRIRAIDGAIEGQAYLPDSNVLRTRLGTAAGGELTITDFMPVGRSADAADHEFVDLHAPHWLVRVVQAGGSRPVEIEVEYSPAGPDYARGAPELRLRSGRIEAAHGPVLYSDLPFEARSGAAAARETLAPGERRVLVLAARPAPANPVPAADRLLRTTRAFWREWLAHNTYRGRYGEAVRRSALTLKMLTYAPSGAVVAAPTTSLPELLGGERNWDYRYSWLRDATFTLYALAALGYHGEARRFSAYLRRCLRRSAPELRILYGIEGEDELPERELRHLHGYCASRPVRTGNGAYRQRQLDVYGELLDWALLYRTLGGHFPREEEKLLHGLADVVASVWDKPGQGIWEQRSAPRHYVYSKIACWVALDRAIRLFGARESWRQERERIRRAVAARGIDPRGGWLRQAFDAPGLDAAVLMAPVVGFPLEPATLDATIEAVRRRLAHWPYVRRYSAEEDDGLHGEEGAFLVCSFWLVNALLFRGRHGEAVRLFEALQARANPLGLYAEEVDAHSGAMLGNFPQGLTHLALVISAFAIDLYETGGREALDGAHADRAQRHAHAIQDVHTLWMAFARPRRGDYIRSTPASRLPPLGGSPART